METCPYCGEEQYALKNHVRLASGDGHGPSGTYPDDFEDGTTDPPPTSQDDAAGRESGADVDQQALTEDSETEVSTGDLSRPLVMNTSREYSNRASRARLVPKLPDTISDAYNF